MLYFHSHKTSGLVLDIVEGRFTDNGKHLCSQVFFIHKRVSYINISNLCFVDYRFLFIITEQSGQPLYYACSRTLFLGLSFAVVIKIFADVRKMNNQAVTAKHSGMIILGGGLVKHHVNNANLMVREKCVKKLLPLYIIHSRYQYYMFLLFSAYLNIRRFVKVFLCLEKWS